MENQMNVSLRPLDDHVDRTDFVCQGPISSAEIRKHLEPCFKAWSAQHQTKSITKKLNPLNPLKKLYSKIVEKKKESLLLNLPTDVLATILNFLPQKDLRVSRLINTSIKKIINERTSFWKQIELEMLATRVCKPILKGFGPIKDSEQLLKTLSIVQCLPFVSSDLLRPVKLQNTISCLLTTRKSIVRSIDESGNFVIGFVLKDHELDNIIFVKLQESTSKKWESQCYSQCYPERSIPRPFDYIINEKEGEQTFRDKDCLLKIQELYQGRMISAGLILDDKYLNFSLAR